jgi:hypothetical protein
MASNAQADTRDAKLRFGSDGLSLGSMNETEETQGMVADQRKPRLHAETFLRRANGKTFDAIQRLLVGTEKRPFISSSLLSETETGALGLPQSVIPSVQDLAQPLVDVLNRGGKGWRGYALAICCEIVGGNFDQLEDWLAFSEILHAGSLIVDDVEAGAKLRRGGPACHLLYGTPTAINSGTLAYFQVQFLIENSGLSDVQKAAITRSISICSGWRTSARDSILD